MSQDNFAMASDKPPTKLIEAGSGRRPNDDEPYWYRTLANRVSRLRADGDHPSFTYSFKMPDKRATREQIVRIYELALDELASTADELARKLSEALSDNHSHKASIEDLLQRKKDLEHRLGQTGRRLWAVLELLEKRFYDEFPQVSGMDTTDYYFDGDSMYDDREVKP